MTTTVETMPTTEPIDTEFTALLMNERPVDYYDEPDRGVVAVLVGDGEDVADMIVKSSEGTARVRLDRDELAQLIGSLARAMALLS